MIHSEKYAIGENTFEKRYYSQNNVKFFKNNNELSLKEWNVEINSFQSMELKEKHPNPLVRFLNNHRLHGLAKLIGEGNGRLLADIGADTGALSKLLIDQQFSILCVDIDAKLLEIAKKNIGKPIEVLESEITALNLPDKYADVVVASEVLEHIPEPERGINELIRVTKPGGEIFISVPNDKLIVWFKKMLVFFGLRMFLGKLSAQLAIGHVHVFNKKKLKELAKNKPVTIKKLFLHYPFCLNYFMKLERH